jgi:hypothetical protein
VIEPTWEPFRESAPDRYSRLFPPAAPYIDFEQLCDGFKNLAGAMVDDGSRVAEEKPEILLEAGYTYFGQFVAHDLTKDVSTIDEIWRREPHELPNAVTPRLDLDLLYGKGPEGSPELYEPDGLRLKVGADSPIGRSFDICTNDAGHRVLADERTSGNLILRQMAAVFARLHNFVVEQLHLGAQHRHRRFDQARRQTQWQYQWLICKDYLPTVLNLTVFRKVFGGHASVRWQSFSIPVEFSAAAMRFGHAMVRPNYLLSLGREMFLPHILLRNPDRGALAEDARLNWGLFFQGAGAPSALTARPIDTRLSFPLHELPDDLIGVPQISCPHARIAANPAELPLRTLLRGAGLRLASGQTAARQFGEPVLTDAQLTRDSLGEETSQGRILRESHLLGETPLWYYILKESEVRENGNRLGPTGSHIVAETIYHSLRTDPDSILNVEPFENIPPIWNLPDGSERIYGLTQLFRLAPLL